MAAPTTITTPNFTGVVNREFFIAPLGGAQHPQSYLDRFPDNLYNTAIDSHLVKFLYAALGPAGIGWLRNNYLQARLILEDYGVELFDLDKFYGDPLSFPRILEEVYDQDPRGLLDRASWEELRTKDAKYRNRAIDYVTGARAGNTPQGMHLVARSGLGHEVEIIENYRYLYDIHSDDPLGLPYYGHTLSTEEMIVLPRREIPQSEVQIITISGTATAGYFTLFFPVGNESANSTHAIAYNATRDSVQQFLDAVPSLGRGNTSVTGGPLPDTPIRILFTGKLAASDVPQLQASNNLSGSSPSIRITTERSGNNSVDETVSIGPRDMHYAQTAIGRIKPVTAIVTFASAAGLRSTVTWNNIATTSVYQEVARYVTGRVGVPWPSRDNANWIESGIEHEGRRPLDALQHHYQGFHNVVRTYAYTGSALSADDYNSNVESTTSFKSEHVGPFLPFQRALYPSLRGPFGVDEQLTSDQALADYAEPLTMSATREEDDQVQPLVNGIYPASYQSLSGIAEIRYKNDQFWASREQGLSTEYLELDLGTPQAVNYLIFETMTKPFTIDISYDILDGAPARDFRPVLLASTLPSISAVGFEAQTINKWRAIENYFSAPDRSLIFTRFIRIGFTRQIDINSPFYNQDGTLNPYSIEVRNLRVGRNVS